MKLAITEREKNLNQMLRSFLLMETFCIQQKNNIHVNIIKLLIENKLIICALENYKISREKFEPEPGFERRTSEFLARHSTT